MKIPISEIRKRLPRLIKELQRHPANVYEITRHREVVARLTAPPIVEPGHAASALLELRKKWRGRVKMQPLPHGTISENTDAYLYGTVLAGKKTRTEKRR